MEPPPAPIVTMSTIGSGSGQAPTWPLWVSAIRPPCSRQMSAEVPPISTVTMSPMPHAAAASRAPTTPAAGPDSAVSNGARPNRGAAGHAAVRLHQQQRRRHAGFGQPRRQASNVAADRRHHAGVQHRGQAAFVLPHHRQHIHRGSDRHAGQLLRAGSPRRGVHGRDRRRSAAGTWRQPARRAAAAHRRRRARWPRRAAPARRRRGQRARSPPGRVRGVPGGAASPRRTGWRRGGCPGGRSPCTWRKPAVVTRAVRAVLPSRIRLVATVVPCSTRPIAAGVASGLVPARRARRP